MGQICKKTIEFLKGEMKKIYDWCNVNGVKINFDKTEYMVFHKDKDLSSKSEIASDMILEGNSIKRVYTFKYLGVWFEPSMRFNKHFHEVSNKVTQRLKYLCGIKRYLTFNVMKVMISAYVHSVVEYAIDVWAVQTNEMLSKLQAKINRFILKFMYPNIGKLIGKKNVKKNVKICMYDDILSKCEFLSVIERRDYVSLDLILSDYYRQCCNEKNVDILFGTLPTKIIPTFKSEIFKNSLIYRSYKLWNSLPRDFKIGVNFSKNYLIKFVCNNRNSDYINF